MCVVSMVMDHYRDRWDRFVPNTPFYPPSYPSFPPATVEFDLEKYKEALEKMARYPVPVLQVSKDELDVLRAEVLELRRLIEAAKLIDEKTGQPDCEVDEKVYFVRRIAEMVGVDLEDALRKTRASKEQP